MWNLDDLKDSVSKVLVTVYDFTVDEADDAIDESVASKPDFWNENSEPNDLAKYLAEDDDED